MWGETSRLCLLLFGLFIKITKCVDGKIQIHEGLFFLIQTWIYLNREPCEYVRILKQEVMKPQKILIFHQYWYEYSYLSKKQQTRKLPAKTILIPHLLTKNTTQIHGTNLQLNFITWIYLSEEKCSILLVAILLLKKQPTTLDLLWKICGTHLGTFKAENLG